MMHMTQIRWQKISHISSWTKLFLWGNRYSFKTGNFFLKLDFFSFSDTVSYPKASKAAFQKVLNILTGF